VIHIGVEQQVGVLRYRRVGGETAKKTESGGRNGAPKSEMADEPADEQKGKHAQKYQNRYFIHAVHKA
jgi:hypothetical protein